MTTGDSVAVAAEKLGTTPSNIYRELRKPHVKKEMQQRALDHLGVLAPIAMKKQAELLNADSEHVQASVAENILDRQLGKPVQRQLTASHTSISVSIDLG